MIGPPKPADRSSPYYGHDRLYVAHPDGRKLGWWDLVTDEAHPASPQCLPTLQDAVARWKTGQHPGNPTTAHPVDAVSGTAMPGQPVTRSLRLPPPAPSPPDSNNLPSALAAPSAPDGGDLASALARTPALALDKPEPGGTDSVVHASTSGTPEPLTRPWVDLAANTPGAQAREQARAAREAAPVKTVLARLLGVHTAERA